MHPHLFKKNLNQSRPKKMVNKYANKLDVTFKYGSWRKHKYDINIFWGVKKKKKKKQTKAKFGLLKKL